MKNTLASLFILLILLSSCTKNKTVSNCDATVSVPNENKVEGYTDKVSYGVGDTINFKIHSLSPTVDLSIYHYGQNTNLVHSNLGISSFAQDYNCRSYSYGCNWETTYEYVVPSHLKPGIYSATVTNDLSERCYITFVIKNPDLTSSDIVVLASTNTWQAYNNWSGQSFYKYGLHEEILHSTIVSFMRPNSVDRPTGNDGHLVNAELHLHRWLDSMGHDYDVIADIDLHNDASLLDNYKVLILNCHPEYWTTEMYQHLTDYLENGGNLMYLGANGVYWRVALAFNRIEVKKQGDTHLYDSGKGGMWRDLGKPESAVLGIHYTEVGYGTYAPYSVLLPNHWVFDNTNLNQGDLIGEVSLNRSGASGHETDKVSPYSPQNIQILAQGQNPNNGGADMIFYQDSISGSKVFSVGSITYTGSLSVDSNISTITNNVILNFLQ